MLRRVLLAGWSGAPALLADGVLGLATLVLISELLGLVGPARRGAAGRSRASSRAAQRSTWIRWSTRDQEASGPPRRPEQGLQGGAAGEPLGAGHRASAIAGLVALQWAGPTLLALDRGIYGGDSLWYHMPFAAHIAQTGSVTELLFTDPLYLNWFYPQVSELVHADGLLLFGNDFLSPLLNLAWLGLALFAAWCCGRPYGAGRPAVAAVGALMSAEPPVLAPAGQRQQRRRRDRPVAGQRRDPAERPRTDGPGPAAGRWRSPRGWRWGRS